MVEELKLAIKIDDDAIEQALLKQFANAEKMANKVVLTFNNIDLDNKAIEAKFKEMQKIAGKNPIDLSIDKSSIEMLSAISKQLGNIFDIAKGKSIIDSNATVAEINKITQATKELNKAQTGSENIQSKSFTTKNKTEAYNQLKQTADVFKNFYGNEEAMHTKAGTEAAYAYYKAYEEALRKGVAESKLQKVTVDVDKDGFFNAERISSTRIEEFANFEKYGGEVTALSEEISYFEKRLLKFSDAYSQIQSKLGKVPITPEIIQNIEEYVRNLEIAESRVKDADLMGFTKEDIDIYKDSANMHLGFAIEDAIKENEKYISSLKEVSEEKEKVDVSLNKSQTSDMDSSVVEQQNKIQEELKETQKQAEQTSESLSKIGDVDKSNISSGTHIEDVFQGDDKVNTDASTTAIKEESQALEQVSTSAKDAATSKEKFANANKEVKASADETSISVDKEISALEKAGSRFESQAAGLAIKPDDQHQFSSWKKQLEDLNIEIAEYKSKVENLSKIDIADEAQINKAKTEIEELGKSIKETITVMSKTSQSDRGWTQTGVDKLIQRMNDDLKKNSNYTKETKRNIQGLIDELNNIPDRPLSEVFNDFSRFKREAHDARKEGKAFFEIFKEKVIYGGAAQLAGMVGFYDVINVGREAFNVIKDLDSAYTEMRKVSDETTQSLKNFQSASFDVAKQVGVTALEIQNSAADFMRLGYSLEEASKLSEDANIYANVGDMDISEATEHMISSIQAWQSEFSSATEASTNIINRYNEIGNRFAITSADIGSAMERSAAALKAGGNDLNESIGIITAGNLIQQDADTTANAIKVLSLRLRGAKADLESMNEETDGLVESTSKMREQIQALTGVDIMIDDSTFKSTAKIIQEIGAEWSNLSDVSQAATLELLAGKTRASTVAGLIENYQTIGEVIEAAEESENSARIENEKYLDSMEGRLNLMTSQLQEMASVSLNDNLLKEGISALTKILELITDIVDTFGLLPTAAGIGGIVAGIKNVGQVKMWACLIYAYPC